MINSVHPVLILNSGATQYAAAFDCHENVQVGSLIQFFLSKITC